MVRWLYLLAIPIAFLITGNLVYLILFPLIRLSEWLAFALKIAIYRHQEFKRSKPFINFNGDTKPSSIKWVKIVSPVCQIKDYTRSAYDCQYEEKIKQSLPSWMKVLTWLLFRIKITHVTKSSIGKRMNQPKQNLTMNQATFHLFM